MYRDTYGFSQARWKSPHRRGDVPSSPHPTRPIYQISPQAWGCTVAAEDGERAVTNLPTGVGMYRRAPRADRMSHQSPHRRGDVPIAFLQVGSVGTISPQAWGCTGHNKGGICFADNLPTGVGMYRQRHHERFGAGKSPHRRGDVPVIAILTITGCGISPQAWGCTASL